MQRWPDTTENAKCERGIDWTGWLDSGVTISSVAWDSDPDDLTFSNSTIITGNVASVEITNASAGVNYKVKCSATLSNGLIEERSVILNCVDHKAA